MFTKHHDYQAVRRSDPAEQSPAPKLLEGEVEAPDRGEDHAEPLEEAVARAVEAPEAREGRLGLIEHEYTHGRSMT